MKCPKCGYNSFDYLTHCKKCGRDLRGERQQCGLDGEVFILQQQCSAETCEAEELDSGTKKGGDGTSQPTTDGLLPEERQDLHRLFFRPRRRFWQRRSAADLDSSADKEQLPSGDGFSLGEAQAAVAGAFQEPESVGEIAGDDVAEPLAAATEEGLQPPLELRIWATLVDWGLLSALYGAFVLSVEGMWGVPPWRWQPLLQHWLPYYLLLLALSLGYFSYCHYFLGQTPGKMLFGLRLESWTDNQLGLGSVLLRWVGSLLAFLPLGAGFWWALRDANGRGWNDYIAGTRVVWLEDSEQDMVAEGEELPSASQT